MTRSLIITLDIFFLIVASAFLSHDIETKDSFGIALDIFILIITILSLYETFNNK